MSRILRTWRSWLACAALLACHPGRPDQVIEAAVPAGGEPSPVLADARHSAWGRRRAVLVGINDYSASRLAEAAGRRKSAPDPGQRRDWPNLAGAVNDVQTMREMLILRYGFAPQDIITLTDQAATRAEILRAIEEHLIAPAAPGDIVLFYFAGHGSQVRNSRSVEPDGMDESRVPADSRLGAPDIRDKVLRRLFNRVLDRGARLTVILDSCHSGSGIRGLPTGALPRSIKPDLRDIADGADYGPQPEARGALVIAAAQDFDSAWETWDDQGKRRGAFSWAWAQAMRDAVQEEPAGDTFLRAQARLRADRPNQQPVLAGNTEARLRPFLGDRAGGQARNMVIAVESVGPDGTIRLQGGWAHGLTEGSELSLAASNESGARLKVIKMLGLGRSEARLTAATALPATLKSGALLEIVGWAAPPGRPLRVWMPAMRGSIAAAVDLAKELARQAAHSRIRWIEDPTAETPTHVLRWHRQEWELLAWGNGVARLGASVPAAAVLAKVPAGSSLFVQIPAPDALIQEIEIGPGTGREGIQPMDGPDVDYTLVGRLEGDRLDYAWLRPAVGKADQASTSLPLRTAWHALDFSGPAAESIGEAALILEDAVLRLKKVHGWLHLDSPPNAISTYRLGVKRARDGVLVEDGVLVGEEEYGLVLRANSTPPREVPSRYFYAFIIDSNGRGLLLHPRSQDGPIENCFPLPCDRAKASSAPPSEIPLGPPLLFTADEPFGTDTYFLLSSDESLPSLSILEWDGVRGPRPQTTTPLEELLALTSSTTRGTRIVTPANWSLERVSFQSVPSRERSVP